MAVGSERICEQCQGRCCQGHPGVYTQPERFWRLFAEQEQPSLKLLELHAPRWHLQVRYVRNVPVPSPQRQHNGSCVFLSVVGCQLPRRLRPDQCLALQPHYETLLHDEILCGLPPEHRLAEAVQRWRRFWQQL